MAGYSTTPLKQKLGIKAGDTVMILHEPENYSKLVDLSDIKEKESADEKADFIHYFTTSEAELIRDFQRLMNSMKKDGMLWVSWPKTGAKMLTDLNENKIRDIALQFGLVDVKVCAVDDVWSGLKLVYRVKDR